MTNVEDTVLPALLKIKEHVEGGQLPPFRKFTGICDNLIALAYNADIHSVDIYWALHDWLNDAINAFLLATDDGYDTLFPVGGHHEYDRECQNGTLWENPRRLQLLEFMICYVQSQINAREVDDA